MSINRSSAIDYIREYYPTKQISEACGEHAHISHISEEEIIALMKAYARQALEIAAEEAKVKKVMDEEAFQQGGYKIVVDKDSILNVKNQLK